VEKKNIFRIIAAVILTNAAGLLLRFLKLDTYLILLGFRFHLSFVLPFLIVFRESHFNMIKDVLAHPKYNKVLLQLIWIFLPLIILLSILYLSHNIDLNDPDYFYEFGLSSIVDYPIYLLWNLPQLLFFAFFVFIVINMFGKKYFNIAAITILIFAYEIIPLGKEKFDWLNILVIVLSAISASLIMKYFQNVYWFAIIVFTLFWECLLAFGSNSKMLINILFAARYHSWDGFFTVTDKFVPYLLPAQILLAALLITVTLSASKNKL